MDDAEGHGRLNYFKAEDGFGAFDGDVAVTMDASLGGFHGSDIWRNDISGAGRLTKSGSGSLGLAGQNNYSGGTIVENGTVMAGSGSALGLGDAYLAGGRLAVAPEDVEIKGDGARQAHPCSPWP